MRCESVLVMGDFVISWSPPGGDRGSAGPGAVSKKIPCGQMRAIPVGARNNRTRPSFVAKARVPPVKWEVLLHHMVFRETPSRHTSSTLESNQVHSNQLGLLRNEAANLRV